jgi:hypothetical protein
MEREEVEGLMHVWIEEAGLSSIIMLEATSA